MLRALQDAFAATQKGRAVLVQVHGRSGMGKSALVREFLARLQQGGKAVVLAGRCYERESVSFKALDSLIDALAKHLLRLSEPKVAELMPREKLLSRAWEVAAHLAKKPDMLLRYTRAVLTHPLRRALEDGMQYYLAMETLSTLAKK